MDVEIASISWLLQTVLQWTLGYMYIFELWCSQGTCRRRQWHPTAVLLPGNSHGWRSLIGCSPWGCEESDMTEQLHFHFSLLCIGEENGNPLPAFLPGESQGRRSLWAAVYGVAQSWTQLKWLSSSRVYACWETCMQVKKQQLELDMEQQTGSE